MVTRHGLTPIPCGFEEVQGRVAAALRGRRRAGWVEHHTVPTTSPDAAKFIDAERCRAVAYAVRDDNFDRARPDRN
ncbi:MAG: hypothetical protein GWP91_10180 [Rhodobacterales bacterium]|nr:hypothetical protein [Rhodobacterales bacterium]